MIVLRSSVGIDFRDHGLAMVHLQRTFQGCLVRHSALHTFPPDADSETLQEMASQEIRNFFRRNRIRTDQVRVGIPRREVMVRAITLPDVAQKNLDQVIHYEIDRYLPFRADELSFDSYLIGAGRRPKTIRVMLLAVRKERVEWYLNVVRKAGVQPSALETSSTALANAFGHSAGNGSESLILVETGLRGVEVNVVVGRSLVFSRFTECPAEGISECLRTEIERAVAQLEEETQRPVSVPPRVILSGKDTSEEIIQSLDGKGDFTCITASPPARFVLSKGLDEKPSQLAVAVGLARGGVYRTSLRINLLPKTAEGQARRLGKKLTSVLVVLLIATALVWQGGELVKQRLELQHVLQQIEKLKSASEAAVLLRHDAEKIKREIEVLSNAVNQKPSTLQALRELARVVPASAWLIQLDYEEEKLAISGYAQTASGLISLIEASPLFEKTKFSAPINVDPQMQRERFQVEAEAKP